MSSQPAPEVASNVQATLRDMVELKMYLVARTSGKPWPLLPRGTAPLDREPWCRAVDLSVVDDLVERGFIENSSSQTFVVSKAGTEFYRREIRPHSEGFPAAI
jgi:hypothetical protein